MHILWIVLVVVLWCAGSGAEAACTGASPIWSADNDPTSVQTCINNAVNGDTVTIASTTADWGSTRVAWSGKDITIQGGGIGVTVVNNGIFNITMTSAGTHNWRLTGMTCVCVFTIDSQNINGATKGWRIDNMRFTNTGPAGSFAPLFYITGVTWGLIDHATFDGNPYQISNIYGFLSSSFEGTSCSPHCLGYGYWNRNLNLGSDEAIYFEDITVNFNGSMFGADIFDMDYGGSVVVRHSTINGAYIQTHSTGHLGYEYGGMKYEIYNNTFNGMNTPSLGTWWGQIRAGTGVFFNNTVTGYPLGNVIVIDGQREGTSCSLNVPPMSPCNGSNSYDGNIESSGWPCVSSCGRGAVAGFDGTAKTQANVPIYTWNNGSTATCASGGACDNTVTIQLNGACGQNLLTYIKTVGAPHSNGQVDYVNNGSTPKPGYTPFTYPHPLIAGRGGSTTTPAAPTNLTVR